MPKRKMLFSAICHGEDREFQQKKEQRDLHDCLPSPCGLVMDENLWSKLPEELLEKVLANLPVDAMLRFRSVCKAWKAFISSYGFVELCYKSSHKGPWCLTISPDCEGSAVYDVAMDKWYRILLPSIAAKHRMQPFNSVGGFICFKNFDNSTFLVYNLLTRSCSDLTPGRTRNCSDKDMAWVVVDQSEGFSVIVVGESRRYEVYDSYSNKWSRVGMLPTGIEISQDCCFPARSVAIDGLLYMVSNFPYDLVTYDIITGSWSKLYVRWPYQSWNHILSEYRGRICMMALQNKHDQLCFCEWELQTKRKAWVKIETMPKSLSSELLSCGNGEWQVHCLANRDLMLLQFVNTNGQKCLILYCRRQKLWKKISDLPLYA
eukprot:c16267_g1_i2 orf=370-1494(-)